MIQMFHRSTCAHRQLGSTSVLGLGLQMANYKHWSYKLTNKSWQVSKFSNTECTNNEGRNCAVFLPQRPYCSTAGYLLWMLALARPTPSHSGHRPLLPGWRHQVDLSWALRKHTGAQYCFTVIGSVPPAPQKRWGLRRPFSPYTLPQGQSKSEEPSEDSRQLLQKF